MRRTTRPATGFAALTTPRPAGACLIPARRFIAPLIAVFLLTFAPPVRAQSTAPAETLPGAFADVTMTLNITTAFGPLSDTQSAAPAVTGTTLITVNPAAAPFDAALVHEQQFTIAPFMLNFEFPVFIFTITLDVTITDLVIVSSDIFDGTVDAAGEATFPQPALLATGQALLVSADLGIDQTIPLDTSLNDPVVVTLAQQGSALVISDLQLPPLDVVFDPADLPAGITAGDATTTLDASAVILRGVLAPSVHGDFNGNGLVDLPDAPGQLGCFATPGGGLGAICTLADFNADGDVDLNDWHLWLLAESSNQ